ncbi:MAG: hypothetical protein P1V51_08700 [Deltaproteobacteria bacterium]|nr:hypothetical protein [Deltaproteobacteria bacterium]
MKLTHLFLALFLLGLTGCPPAAIERRIDPSWVGTPKARMTGYFVTSGAAPGGASTESVPHGIRHDTVIDEATLALTESGQTCFDVVVRTWSGEDEPLEQLTPTCTVRDRPEPAVVEGEVIAVHDYSVMGSREVFSLEGIAPGKFLGMSLSEPEEKTFRVIERGGRLCCAISASGPVELRLTSERMQFAGYRYQIAWSWRTR